MTEFRRHDGAGWVSAAPHRHDGAGWKSLAALARTLDTRRQVTGQCMRTTDQNGKSGGKTYLSRHKVYAHTKDLQLTYGGNLPANVTMDLAVSVEKQDGTRVVATWAGANLTTLNGTTPATTDPVPITVAPGEHIKVHTYYGARSDAGQHLGAPGGWYDAEVLAGNQVATGVHREDTSLQYDGWNGYRPPMPHAITGLTESKQLAVAFLGDSITESGSPGVQYDPVARPGVYGTFGQRAVDAKAIPWANAGLWASQFAKEGRAGLWTPIPDLRHFTHVITAWGYNDLDQAHSAGAAATTVMNNAITTWNWIVKECPRIWQTTVTPSASSTDSWTTLAGQTAVASSPLRATFNDWVRDGAPILAGVAAPGTTDPAAVRAGQAGHPLLGTLEIADTVMSARNSGIFRVDQGAVTGDGGHPNKLGHELMAAPITTWVGTLTV